MKPKTNFFQVILLFLTSAALTAQTPAVDSTPFYKVPKPQVDVKHVSLDLKFDWLKKQAFGTATLTFSPLKVTDSIVLDAAYLSILQVRLSNGSPLKFNYKEGATDYNLNIKLNKKYRPGDELSIVITYKTNWVNATDPANIAGSDGKGIRFFEPSSTEPNRRKQIWSMSEGEGSPYWFPGFGSPGDLRTSDFKATLEKPLMIISNGLLLSEKDNGDGTRTFHYRMDKPYPQHKTAFVAGEYEMIKNTKSPIINYAYPDEKEATIATIERLGDMNDYFSKLTGKTFPFKQYSQVFVQEIPWGNAAAGLSVQTENMVDDYATHADYFYLWDMLEGESLAAQWFGNDISPADWSHIWLEKAFARYFSCLYNEHKNGKDEFLLYQLTFDQANYFNDWYNGNRHPVVTTRFTDINGFINENYPKSRGALVLHMLRKELGEQKWGDLLKHYVQRFSGKAVVTEDLIQSVNAVAGRDMSWFFDQWIFSMGHPVFEVSKTYNTASKQLILTAKQIQELDTTNQHPRKKYFKGKMLIRIDDDIKEVFIEDQAENVFSFSFPENPKLVNFDLESTWIKEVNFQKSTEEWLWQLKHDTDILARNQALSELSAIAKDSAGTEKEKIQEAFRALILSDQYWRIRYNTLLWLQGIEIPNRNAPSEVDSKTKTMILTLIQRDSSWVRAAALSFLGLTKNPEYADLYLSFLNDKSDRVVNAAAIALGRTKKAGAFEALVKLKDKPSWKNQSLISSLNGMKELGDERGISFALNYIQAARLSHWTLGTSTWDHRLAAAETLVALGEGSKAYPLIIQDFENALKEDNKNDIFYNLQQLSILADARGGAAFKQAAIKYNNDQQALEAVKAQETRFDKALKKE